MDFIMIFWPLIVLQIALAIGAVIDISKREDTKTLSKPVWLFISIVIATIGPIAYFLFGRGES